MRRQQLHRTLPVADCCKQTHRLQLPWVAPVYGMYRVVSDSQMSTHRWIEGVVQMIPDHKTKSVAKGGPLAWLGTHSAQCTPEPTTLQRGYSLNAIEQTHGNSSTTALRGAMNIWFISAAP